MKKLLRKIRRTGFINYPTRHLIRFFHKYESRWPVSGIINCKFENVEFKLYNNCDDHAVDHFFYNKPFYEIKIIRLMKRFTQESNCILDIGANTGIHSVISAISNTNCKVFSIEPYSPNYKRLEINKSLNKCNNINLVTNALGSSRGQLKFFVPSDNSITEVSSAIGTHGNRIYPEVDWKETEVSQITFDDLIEKTGKIDFFKCDVESFEIEVIKGGSNFFKSNRPPFIIEICLDDAKCSFFNEFAQKNNYIMYLISEDGLCKLESLYNFDRWPNLLFTQYEHPHNFVPNNDLEKFVDSCISSSSLLGGK